MRQIGSSILELIFLGRSRTQITGIMLLESLILTVGLFTAAPIKYTLPASERSVAIIFGLTSVVFVILLYWFLSYLSYQTYSIKLHNPVYIGISTLLYLGIAGVCVIIWYWLFVYPFADSLPSTSAEISMALLFVTVVAIILVLSFLANDMAVSRELSKHNEIENFLDLAEEIREKSTDDLTSEPDQLVNSGEEILSEMKSSRFRSTRELALDFENWLETFDNKGIRGQKKMIGDIPESDTSFAVWEDRYRDYQSVESALNNLKSSAAYKIGLSVKSISV